MIPSKDKIRVFSNFIDQEDIDFCLNLLETKTKERWKYNPRVLIVPNTVIASFYQVVKHAYRVTELIKEVFNIPQKEIYCVNSELGTWTYEGGSGQHEDSANEGYLKFSSIIYLTDDYEGGEIVFPELDFEYKPKAGDLILFPSHGYLHEVKPVLSGNRSTIVGFFSDVHPALWSPDFRPSEYEMY